jgi:DNA polymerase-3 subunit epsilon
MPGSKWSFKRRLLSGEPFLVTLVIRHRVEHMKGTKPAPAQVGDNCRRIALMIETTGMAIARDDRIVEVGAVEIGNRELTLRRFHSYVRADLESDAESFSLHGLATKFLADKPSFEEIAGPLAEFLSGAALVVLPCDWTVKVLDHEWTLAGMQSTAQLCAGIKDIVPLARRRAPGQKVNLNALCNRYRLEAPATLKGTLLDAWMLAKAYLELTRPPFEGTYQQHI